MAASLFCSCLAAFCFAALPARGQVPQLDKPASEILKEVRPFQPRLIAVADFRAADSSGTLQAHYFAWLLSITLKEKAKKIVVADHPAFDADLARLHLSPADLLPGDSLRANASRIGAEILVTGTVQKSGDQYLLHIEPVRVASAEALPALNTTVKTSEFFESFFTPMPANVAQVETPANSAGISMPTCIYCPDPPYSDAARAARIQGALILDILVSTDGRPTQIRPAKLLGHGLDEQAYQAVKNWKFHPARDAQGTPIPIIVPVEVTFKLF